MGKLYDEMTEQELQGAIYALSVQIDIMKATIKILSERIGKGVRD